jgi:uncharacterized protein YuzE
MKVKYDRETDTLRILFKKSRVEESEEKSPGIIIDYDAKGNVVGFEVLNASKRIENPMKLDPVEVA